MATRMHIFGKPNYIYPQMSENDFEFDESDIHNLGDLQTQPENSVSVSRLRNKPAKVGGANGNRKAPKTRSLPVNIPDWSKILKNEYKGHPHVVHDNDEKDDQEINDGDTVEIGGKMVVPPHVYLARKRGPSFSVLEGIGRTLKGRDLRRVRDAIWEKLGFQD